MLICRLIDFIRLAAVLLTAHKWVIVTSCHGEFCTTICKNMVQLVRKLGVEASGDFLFGKTEAERVFSVHSQTFLW